MRSKRMLILISAVIALLLAAPPARAERQLTFDQLQQLLQNAQAQHSPDAETARKLNQVKVAARLDSQLLKQLIEISPGPRTTRALNTIADASAFFDPPSIEILTRPAPDLAAQKAILRQTIHYVVHVLPTLPNFTATRVTESFVNSPLGFFDPGARRVGEFYFADTSRLPITVQDGIETDAPESSATNLASPPQEADAATKHPGNGVRQAVSETLQSKGLVTWGEFGPILGVVLVDAAKGKLAWARWEQYQDKPAAVFRFSVDRTISHYTVQSLSADVVASSGGGGGGGRGGRSGGGGGSSLTPPGTGDSGVVRKVSGYHGLLTVDPDSGTVLRVSIEADLGLEEPVRRAAMMVEYSQLQIGDGAFELPTRSVSMLEARQALQGSPFSPLAKMTELYLNHVDFTDYHHFGSDSLLVTESKSRPQPAAGASQIGAAQPPPADSQPVAPSPAVSEIAEVSDPAAESVPAAPPSIPVRSESDEEILVREVNSLPGIFSGPASTDVANAPLADLTNSASFTLKVTTRTIDLGLVANDKHNHPLTDLKPGEIEIYDNGRKQQLVAFSHPSAELPGFAPNTAAAEPADSFSNLANPAAQTAPHDTNAPGLLVLVLDENHLPLQDLNRARSDALRFLKSLRSASPVALYSVTDQGFRVIQESTQDHALLMARLAAWVPLASGPQRGPDSDRRSRQQFDSVHNIADLNRASPGAPASATGPQSADSTSDSRQKQVSSNPLRGILESLIALTLHLAPVPGHKSLALISGDSVLAEFQERVVSTDKGTRQLEPLFFEAQEALNEAHASLYAIDASSAQTSGDSGGRSRGGASLTANPAVQDASQGGGASAGSAAGGGGGGARLEADLQQNTRGIQQSVRQLTEATGGRAINKGPDLNATLEAIDRDSAAFYELSFDPDLPADGKLHTLEVKIPGRKDAKLRYRSGYLYAQEPSGNQQRFQQAIWSPRDSTGIALTAETVPASADPDGKSAIKLRIRFADLAFNGPEKPAASPGSSPARDPNPSSSAARWSDHLYIFLAERNAETGKAAIRGVTLRLSLKPATYESAMPAGIPYRAVLEAKSLSSDVRLIVVDGNSGKLGSLTIPASALTH